MILLSFFFLQVSAGRVYDSVLVAAEGINRAIKGGVDFSRHPDYLGLCGDWGELPENSNGKELARHLNEVSKYLLFLLCCSSKKWKKRFLLLH